MPATTCRLPSLSPASYFLPVPRSLLCSCSPWLELGFCNCLLQPQTERALVRSFLTSGRASANLGVTEKKQLPREAIWNISLQCSLNHDASLSKSAETLTPGNCLQPEAQDFISFTCINNHTSLSPAAALFVTPEAGGSSRDSSIVPAALMFLVLPAPPPPLHFTWRSWCQLVGMNRCREVWAHKVGPCLDKLTRSKRSLLLCKASIDSW